MAAILSRKEPVSDQGQIIRIFNPLRRTKCLIVGFIKRQGILITFEDKI